MIVSVASLVLSSAESEKIISFCYLLPVLRWNSMIRRGLCSAVQLLPPARERTCMPLMRGSNNEVPTLLQYINDQVGKLISSILSSSHFHLCVKNHIQVEFNILTLQCLGDQAKHISLTLIKYD